MAKPARRRALPSTPQEDPGTPAEAQVEPEREPSAAGESASVPSPVAQIEPDYLISGTRCVAGHPPGQELDAGRLGRVPTRKQSRIGFGLICWCFVGALFLADGRWAPLALEIAAVWLAFAAIVVRVAGHRRRCWRTRTWRHAWGGLAPDSDSDPTRPAGT